MWLYRSIHTLLRHNIPFYHWYTSTGTFLATLKIYKFRLIGTTYKHRPWKSRMVLMLIRTEATQYKYPDLE